MKDPDDNFTFDYFYQTEEDQKEVDKAAKLLGFKISRIVPVSLEHRFLVACFSLDAKKVAFFSIDESYIKEGTWEHTNTANAEEIVSEIVAFILDEKGSKS